MDLRKNSSIVYKILIGCGNKMPTRCNRWYLLQNLLLAQHVSGHHYAHHQELESIIQMVAACGIWCFGFQVVGMVWSWGLCVWFAGCCFKTPNTTGSDHLYNALELLMMGIMVPETCWASNKICNKYHLLHLVGILFPHINDDARSESLQTIIQFENKPLMVSHNTARGASRSGDDAINFKVNRNP